MEDDVDKERVKALSSASCFGHCCSHSLTAAGIGLDSAG